MLELYKQKFISCVSLSIELNWEAFLPKIHTYGLNFETYKSNLYSRENPCTSSIFSVFYSVFFLLIDVRFQTTFVSESEDNFYISNNQENEKAIK